MRSTSCGSEPPLVSHSTSTARAVRRRAPRARAARTRGCACSRRRSARRRTARRRPARARNSTESPTIATPSSSVVPSASVTWKSHDLPTMHTVPTFASTRCRSVSSLSTLPLAPPRRSERDERARRELQLGRARAGRTRRPSGWRRASPPRCSATPSQSSCSAMRSLSSTVSEMPSSCDPSRSVVSKISTAPGVARRSA